jgi:D-arabinose 1-dehydrogenase-like Zn-dependent alcohol dehydrogenase
VFQSNVYKLLAPRELSIELAPVFIDKLDKSEVFANTVYSVISKGTEIAAWQGKPPLRPTTSIYPRLMGYCNLAKVEAIGEDVKGVMKGDFILTHQSHRSSFKCSQEDILLSFPASTSRELLKKITPLYLYHLGYASLMKSDYRPGSQVAIIGMGVLGIVTSELVKVFGGQPYCFSNQNVSIIKEKFGTTYLYKKEYSPEIYNNLSVGMKGFDIVINTSNAWSDHQLSMQIARKGGVITCLGFPGRGGNAIDKNPLDAQFFYDKQLTLQHCGYIANLDLSPIEKRFTLKRNMQYLASLVLTNQLKSQLLISNTYKWNELGLAYSELEEYRPDSLTGLIEW